MKGIVLAGGKSSRFGDDKALALWQGVPMIRRAVNLLTCLDQKPCVITAAARDYAFLDCRIEIDLLPDRGPLGGLCTAFHHFRDEVLVVVSCDMPLVTKEALLLLSRALKGRDEAAVFDVAGEVIQPFPGVYAPGLRELAESCVQANRLSMQGFFKVIPSVKRVSVPRGQAILENVNSQADLQRILRAKKGANPESDPRC